MITRTKALILNGRQIHGTINTNNKDEMNINVRKEIHMTTVTLSKSCIKIEGHAEFGKKGQDVVCAAVSALGQTLKHIDELYREYNVNEEAGMLRVDFHDPLDIIQSYAIDRREYLEKQLEGDSISKDERMEIEDELEDWENSCRNFAHLAKTKGLIIKNQVDIIVKGIREIAIDYPDHVEVVEGD